MKFTSLFVPFSALAISLWIYVIYRSEHCMVNVLLNGMLPTGTLKNLSDLVQAWMPLSWSLVYRVPGGLWVFAATVIVKNGRVPIKGYQLSLALFPVLIALGIELFQRLGVTDGGYDSGDMFAELAGFFVAYRLVGCAWPPFELSRGWHWRWALCLGSFLILFLADVHR